jgi:hypothetical protein
MESLIQLLLHLLNKVPYHSEDEQQAELDLLRAFESYVGVSGIVPPKAGPTNTPAPPPEVPVPGPVADPVPADQQPPPPTFPGVAPPEDANAFSGVTPTA